MSRCPSYMCYIFLWTLSGAKDAKGENEIKHWPMREEILHQSHKGRQHCACMSCVWGLASLVACLGRKGQCYREKEDQEGAKRKLEVQQGLKSDWRLVCKDWERRTSKNCKKYKVNGLTHMCRAIHVALNKIFYVSGKAIGIQRKLFNELIMVMLAIKSTFYITINNFRYHTWLLWMKSKKQTLQKGWNDHNPDDFEPCQEIILTESGAWGEVKWSIKYKLGLGVSD